MLWEVVRALRCPVCERELVETTAGAARALRCPEGHSFDIARHGYVHLGGPRLRHSGDSAEMVAARAAFLNRRHYDFISRALCSFAVAAVKASGALIVDAGAGTGHHLSVVLDALPDAVGLALDVSRSAVRRAARAHTRIGAVLCDTNERLPIADGAAAALLNVFSPRNGAEFHRVLGADGALLVVTPAAVHLHELVKTLGLLSVDATKEERLERSLGPWFDRAEQVQLDRPLELTHADVIAAIAMGPSAWHLDMDALDARVAALAEPVRVSATVRVALYRPRHARAG